MNPGEAERIGLNLDEAAKIVKNFENPTIDEEESLMFRAGNVNTTARDEYDERVRTKKFNPKKPGEKIPSKGTNYSGQLNEAYLDSMRALKVLQEAVSHETGRPIEDHENAYINENAMSSRNKTEEEAYARDYFEPLCKTVADVLEGKEERYRGLLDYILAKHGLERNALMRTKAIARGMTQATADKTDFAGLTALTGEKDVADAEAAAQQMVDDYEDAFDTSELWARINAATGATLRRRYTSGLLSRDMYEQIRDQYQYYIPLKGWAETTAADIYEYAADGYGLSSALMTAYGRKSVADDPLATIMTDAQRTIMEANRNEMKQKLLNLALNHRTSLLSVGKQWYVRQADGSWKEDDTLIIPPDADADTVDALVKQHEADMEALAQQGDAHTRRAKLKLGMNQKSVDETQHLVRVKRNGTTYCIYVCGDPRAARAVNGTLNPDEGKETRTKKAMQDVKNFMSRAFTSWNPEFVVGNLSRDLMFSGTAVLVKEDGEYAKAYTKNVSKILAKAMIPRLLYKWEHGTLSDNVETERLFKEFLMHGGETGFTQLSTVEKTKKQMQRFLKEAQGGASMLPKRAWRGFWNGDDPEWTKAYKGTSPLLVDITRMLSEAGATTDEYGVKEYPKHWYTGDINPAIVEHLLEGYFGGLGKTVNGAGKTLSMLWDEDARELRNVPVARKFLQSADERSEERKINNDYFKYKEEYDKGKIYLRKLTELDEGDGVLGKADRVTRWISTEEGNRFETLEEYFKDIEILQQDAKEAETDSILQSINAVITDRKREMAEKMDSITSASRK